MVFDAFLIPVGRRSWSAIPPALPPARTASRLPRPAGTLNERGRFSPTFDWRDSANLPRVPAEQQSRGFLSPNATTETTAVASESAGLAGEGFSLHGLFAGSGAFTPLASTPVGQSRLPDASFGLTTSPEETRPGVSAPGSFRVGRKGGEIR